MENMEGHGEIVTFFHDSGLKKRGLPPGLIICNCF